MEALALVFSYQAPSLSCRLPGPQPQVNRRTVNAVFYRVCQPIRVQLLLSRVRNAAERDTTIAVIRSGRCMNIQHLPVTRTQQRIGDR